MKVVDTRGQQSLRLASHTQQNIEIYHDSLDYANAAEDDRQLAQQLRSAGKSDRVAMGSSDTHTVKAFLEAEAHDGPSIVIAYSHCIAHGYDMAFGMNQQKAAVLSGYWPLMRYNPALRKEGKNPFQLDSKAPSIPLKQYAYQEARYSMLARSDPDAARELLRMAQDDVNRNWHVYQNRAAATAQPVPPETDEAAEPAINDAAKGEDEQ